MPTYTVDENREWYNKLPSKRVSAAMVLRREDTVLMVKANYKEYWTFPGGVVDADESPFVAAIRETQEEVGYELSPIEVQFLSCGYIPERYGFHDRLHYFFEAHAVPDSEPELQASEIAEARWVSIGEIAHLADDRASYHHIQRMLETGVAEPYFDTE